MKPSKRFVIDFYLFEYIKYQNIKMHEIFLSSDILCLSKSKLETYLSTNPGEILEQVYQIVHWLSDLIWLSLWHSQTTASRKKKKWKVVKYSYYLLKVIALLNKYCFV